MDRSVKAPGTSSDLSEYKELIAVGTALGVTEAAGLSMQVGTALYGGPVQDVPWHPVGIVAGLATHHLQWTTAATGGAVTLVAGTVATALGSAWLWGRVCDKCSELSKGRKDRPRRSKSKEKIDERARYMARGKELVGLGRAAVAAKAAQLKVQLADGDEPGVLIGRAVVDGQRLYASYEDLHLDIWGPRQGKSTSRVIPAVLEAVGAVVSTSNKRDVVDATAKLREDKFGGRSWVFDPQSIAGQTPTWHWDPAAWVLGGDGDGAEERATELAGIFAASGEANSGDAFFEPEGEDLLAALFLACAIGKRPITDAYKWVTDVEDKTPIKILDAAGDFEEFAAGLASQYAAPERQKAGVFSTAKKMAACLKYSKIRRWVTPAAVDEAPREAFDVEDFVISRDTLYLLSGEKKGNAGPLITAFAAAIADAGEKEGNRHPGGRLPVPLLILLDEAANIVRWPSLPKQYSHFGSRGMVVITILQSWAQGVRCWGSEGMGALWSAANVKVLGSGLDDAGFLRDRSELIGDHYELVSALSKSQGNHRSVSTSRVTERTLTSSDLTAIPRGRAVLFSAGRPAVLIAPVPWMDRPYAAEVRDAITAAETASATQVSDPKSARARRLRVVSTTDQEGRTA